MQNEPLVSIITPMFNAEKYIVETINSVLDQSYKNWEMLIVDNYSTDESRALVKSINDSRIKLIELDFNSGGPARPRNIGVENAKGEYVAFLDADDLWLENKLEKQMKFMAENNLDFSSTCIINIDKSSKILNKNIFKKIFYNKVSKRTICDLIKISFIATSSVIVKKNLDIYFNESTNFISVEDYCVWLALLANDDYRYGYLNEELLYYRIAEGSTSDRNIPDKQKIKASHCISTFILKNKRYDLATCFYIHILKTFFVSSLGKLK